MENKYYTPTIEEFRVGFEYEQVSINPQEDITVSDEIKYEQCTFPDPFVGYNLNRLVLNMCRVKYLDSSDIESLGFTLTYKDNRLEWFKKDTYELIFSKSTSTVIIKNNTNVCDKEGHIIYMILFQGVIKNISELITILKQLNIK